MQPEHIVPGPNREMLSWRCSFCCASLQSSRNSSEQRRGPDRGVSPPTRGDSIRIRSSISPPGSPSTKPKDAALCHFPRHRIFTPQTPAFRLAHARCRGLCDGQTWRGRDLDSPLATAHSVLLLSISLILVFLLHITLSCSIRPPILASSSALSFPPRTWSPGTHRSFMVQQCCLSAHRTRLSSPSLQSLLSPSCTLTRDSLSVTRVRAMPPVSSPRDSHLAASFADAVSDSKRAISGTRRGRPREQLVSSLLHHQTSASSRLLPGRGLIRLYHQPATPPSLLQCFLRYLSLMCFRIRFLGIGIERITEKNALPRLHPYIG